MRVLITSAFIDPRAVGEPRWCYELAKGISERVDTIVISTSPVGRSDKVKDFLPDAKVIETPGWKLGFLDRRVKALVKPNYLKFYGFARKVLRGELDLGGVACGHNFGPLGMRYPIALAGSGLPYIVGPVGGSLQFPPGFGDRDTKDPWYYKLRDFDGMRFRHDPILRAGYREAEYIIGAGAYVERLLSPIGIRNFAVHSEQSIPAPRQEAAQLVDVRKARTGPVRFLIVSRLVYSKGIQLALQAFAQAAPNLPGWRLDILGDGPYRQALMQMAHDLGLEGAVTFHGHVPRTQVDDFYRDADTFVFPSIREPSGTVIFEAMNWGLPMIAADYGGPATHVDPAFGIKIPVDTPQQFVADMAGAIHRIASSRDLRAEMATATLAARERHSMTAMVDFFVRLYNDIGRSCVSRGSAS